nr:hypothetical protein [Tanacetum cinerariifolium]
VDTLTLKLLAGPTYDLVKGSCKSLIELEYHLEEVYKATTDQLDWVNPEGKLTNLTVEERFAFNVSLRMFTRSIIIQRRVEDLEMGVESYQKRLNLTKPDTYRLMRIDELHKFNDGTLTDVRTALDDRLKGIRMRYLPQTTWRKKDLTKMELKKILIEKMEGNKSIQQSDEQRNLYKALVDAYEADKTILESYGDTTILKRRRGDDDDQEGPSAGSDRGSKRRREGGEHESASTPSEPATRSASKSTTGTQSRQMSTSEYAFAEEPVQTICQIDEPPHPPRKPPTSDRDWNKTLQAIQGSAQTWISELAKQADSRSSFNELLDTPIDFSNFIMNRLGVDTLTPELLAGPTYKLMRGSCTSLTELEYHLEEGVSHWGQKRQQFYGFAVNRESTLDVYSKRRIIAVTDLKIVEWHNYKHLDWISVRREDDKIYKFKEGDFKRLCLQDIEDMLLLLVQGKLSNLTFEESFAFNVSLRMFTKSIVIHRSWNGLLGDDYMRETFECYKGPYDSSYADPIFTESALRRSDNENTLSLTNLILRLLQPNLDE